MITVSCYSPTNTNDETDITPPTMSYLSLHIPKLNVLDMNTQISKDENNKFYWHNCQEELGNR